MEPLFNFLLARPLEAKSPPHDAIVIKLSPALAGEIRRASVEPDSASALRIVAQRVFERPVPAPGPRDVAYVKASLAFASAVRSGAVTTVIQARGAIETFFGAAAADLVRDPAFVDLARLAGDRLAAIKYGGRLDRRDSELGDVVRTTAYVARLANGTPDATLPKPAGWMNRVIVLDDLARDGRPPGERPPQPSHEQPPRFDSRALERDRSALRQRRREIEAAQRELAALPADRLLAIPPPESTISPEPLRDTERPPMPVRRGADDRPLRELAISALPPPPETAMAVMRLAPPPSRIALATSALEDLSPRSRRVLAEVSPELERAGLVQTMRRLDDSIRQLSLQEARLDEMLVPHTRALVIGGGVYMATSDGVPSSDDDGEREGTVGVPATHGEITSVGIGDLLVVKQQLKGYEARELSHVDNVLKGEHRSMSTKRGRATELTTVDERETTTEEERDQQSTERFEMQRESSKVQKEDDSLKIGTSLSASYGPMVEFKVTTDLGMSSSKEESHKAAEGYAKEVSTRASTRVTDRVRHMTTLKTIESFEEENVHEWNNVPGTDGHVVGQYQWLEKLYEAQIFNYGSRVLFDVVTPEPAAFIHHTLATQPAVGAEIQKPIPFTLDSDDINIGNYAFYAQRHDAEGIEAPPEPTINISKVFEGVDGDSHAGEVAKTAEVPINDGYEAIHARVHVAATHWNGAAQVVVSVGTRTWTHSGPSVGWNETDLNKQQKSIACTLLTWRVRSVVTSFEITCVRTEAAMEKWRIKTHNAIKQGSLKQMKNYEDDLERAKEQASVEVRRRNPSLNAMLQREELKKQVISVFTAQHFDSFNSIETGGFGLPQVALAEAKLEGPYIRFFEQAFEWEQMMFLYYPYYWGRKSRWVEASFLEDADFEFAAFMKAGAARVVVSVRPGFELAVAHFLETGQIWEGGDPPLVTSTTYLNIVDEIKERQHAPGAELPVGNAWEVRLPTTLILLRKKDSLPAWKKDIAGVWVDAT
jgi:hypothetical protein